MARRAQTAIEFLILVGAVVVFLIGFLVAVQYNVSDRTRENKNQVVRDVAFALQDEINIAQGAPDGYFREFDLPTKVLTSDYTITVEDGLVYVVVTGENYATTVPTPPVLGTAMPGTNMIRKEDGKVCLNVDLTDCLACGNGVQGGIEECDGPSFGGETCLTAPSPPGPYISGTLTCTAVCKIDYSGCS